MLGGFSFFADFTWQFKVILATLPLLGIAIIYIFETLKPGRKPFILLTLVALSVSILLSALWSALFYPTKYYDKIVSVNGRIYDIDNSKTTNAEIIIKTDKINDKWDNHTLILKVDKDTVTQFRKYDVVTINATLSEIPDYDDGFDGKSYYVSKGISGYLNDIESFEIHSNYPDTLDKFFDGLQLKISNKLKLTTDFETGSFLSALIVGDRSDLNGNTKLNFARLGISHILALSGMHLAILTFAINLLLTRLKVRKKIRVAIMLLLVSFYMALTGFSASVVRSGLMLIISSSLFLLSSKSDPLTSLLISVSLIVTFNPTSVFDLSLWLSAFATLGVIVYSEIAIKSEAESKFIKKFLNELKNGILVSVFAFCATFVFTSLRFDNFSIASVITTLLFSFVIQFFIYGGILLLLIGSFIPFGKIMIIFSNAILWLAEKISSIKFIYVSADSLLVKLLMALLSVFFFSFLVLEIKNKRKAVIIILVMLLSVFAVAEIDTLAHRYNDEVVYSPSSSGDVMLLKSGGDVTAIYSGRAVSRGTWDVLDYFAEERLTYIDNLIFAGYSHSTIEFINGIIDGIKVDRIMLPIPTTDEEKGQAEGVSYLLSGYGAYLEFYDQRKYVELGKYKYRLFEKVDYTYAASPQNVYEIVCDDERITYLSCCEYDKLSVSAKALLFNSEKLIIGTSSGTNKYYFEMRLPDLTDIYCSDLAVISEETREYYNKKGASTSSVKTPVNIFD
jgi:competence protein ComEC